MSQGVIVVCVWQMEWTPLLTAINSNKTEIACRLVAARCDINHKGKDGCTALHWAQTLNNDRVTKLLESKGALGGLINRY